MDNKKKVRVIKASYLLQQKVGMGDIDEKKIARSQKVIENQEFDFVPLAKEHLETLNSLWDEAKALPEGQDGQQIIDGMTDAIMQIKANASMFGYDLIGQLANIMLNFLETIEKIDIDVIEIVGAHIKTLDVIVSNNLKGEGGEYGGELTAELKDACRRYFAKMASKGTEIKDHDAFFID